MSSSSSLLHRCVIASFSLIHAGSLFLLPGDFRRRNGTALRDAFRDALEAASSNGSLVRLLATAMAECLDALGQAAALRRRSGRWPASARLDTLRSEIRFAARNVLERHAISVILALALGIGATTAVFSVVDTVLLRRLPYPEADRLVRVGTLRPDSDALGTLSPPLFDALTRQIEGLESVSATSSSFLTLTGIGRPERLLGGWVSGGFFELMGATPHVGRLLHSIDDDAGSQPTVVLGFDLWRRLFGSDPAAIGQSITLDRTSYVVVGVMDPGFVPPEGLRLTGTYDLWLPLAHRDIMAEPDLAFLDAVALVGKDVTTAAAGAEIDALGRALGTRLGLHERIYTSLQLAPLHEQTVGDIGTRLWALMGAVALLLLIACSNVANLMATRAAERAHEMSLRVALGAGGGRIIRLLLLESALLAILGGITGATIAYGSASALRAFSPASIPRLAEVTVDVRVLVFTLAVSAVVGLLVGLLPAIHARRVDPARALGASSRTTSPGRRHSAFARVSVATQTALALVLLVGAGLLMRSFVRLYNVDVGFETAGLMRMQVGLGGMLDDSDEAGRARVLFFDELRRGVAALSGVHEAHLTSGAPFSSGGWFSSIAVPDRGEGQPGGPDGRERAYRHQVSGGYLTALGFRILEGRAIGEEDRAGSTPVVVVNESLAQRYWPQGDAIGSRVTIGGDRTNTPRTVVGIVSNARYHELESDDELHVYLPFEQFPAFAMDIMARFEGPPAAAAASMREAVWSLRDDLAIRDVSTMRELVHADLVEPGFYAWLLGSFALAALSLSTIGIYGSVAHTTSLRTREIGTRIAVGGRPSQAVAVVVRGAMGTMALGIAAGLIGAYATSRFLETFLYEVSATDGLAFVTAAFVLTLVGLVAAYIPARRAARVDPMVTLRS